MNISKWVIKEGVLLVDLKLKDTLWIVGPVEGTGHRFPRVRELVSPVG